MSVILKPYPNYKDSGVPWLGVVPEHWETKPLKRWVWMNAEVMPETTAPDYEFRYLDIGSVGTGHLTQKPQPLIFSAAPSRARRVAHKDDTIISTVRTYLKAVYFVEEDVDNLVCSTGFAVLTPRFGSLPKFVSYVALSSPFTNQVTADSVGIAYPAIAETRLGSFHVAVPPLPEQAAIVRFLDHYDRKIRRFIHAKQKLIKLLEEQKQAIISKAVTRGLDPNVRLKPSGVEWLGDVPEHWDVWRLKHLLVQPLKYGANEAAEQADHKAPRYIRITDINKSGNLVDKTFRSIAEEVAKPYLLQDGDILLARSGATVGKAYLYSEAHGRAAYAGYLIRARVNPRRILPSYLYSFLQSRAYWNWISSITIQATIQNVSAEKYASLSLPLPSSSEQSALLRTITDETRAIKSAMLKAQNEISLIREYRTRLIADVVTGKLDVRNVPIEEPEDIEELPELEDVDDESPISEEVGELEDAGN